MRRNASKDQNPAALMSAADAVDAILADRETGIVVEA
jgi:hypothetical protein